MVFGLFGARKASAAPTAATPALPALPAQLRTPSPSESASVATGPPPSPEPAVLQNQGQRQYARSESPRMPPDGGPKAVLDPAELLALVKQVPPKTLHTYVLSHLPHAAPHELHALAEFFATLTPPPRLHCVRCHKNFVEVENDDRSCFIQHDDESAEVERVGNAVGGGATYETIWGCCAKTVEGDGDQGPPDGWCYEGKHTTDVKRARFRADSTPHDDKLVSCNRRRCFSRQQGSENTRSRRERTQKFLQEESEDEYADDVLEEDEDGLALVDVRNEGQRSRKKKGKGKSSEGLQGVKGNDMMDVEESDSGQKSISGKSKRKLDSMKPKSLAKLKAASKAAAPTMEQAAFLGAPDVSLHKVDDSEVKEEPKPKPKRRPRKSGTASDGGKYVPPKEEEEEDTGEEGEGKPKKKRRKAV